jgi:hypothetical protein
MEFSEVDLVYSLFTNTNEIPKITYKNKVTYSYQHSYGLNKTFF